MSKYASKLEALVFAAVVFVTGVICAVEWRKAGAGNGDAGYPTSGNIVAQGYNRDRQTVYFRNGLTVADSDSVSTALAAALAHSPSEVFGLNGRPTLMVSCRFAAISTNTCVVEVIPLGFDGTNYYVNGKSQRLTASASATQDRANPVTGTGAGYFMAPDLYFDGHGATNALVLLKGAPSQGGAVDFWVGSE